MCVEIGRFHRAGPNLQTIAQSPRADPLGVDEGGTGITTPESLESDHGIEALLGRGEEADPELLTAGAFPAGFVDLERPVNGFFGRGSVAKDTPCAPKVEKRLRQKQSIATLIYP